jgi:ABC-type branched-subunit amino acid transport system substrate-binding protein
MSTGSTGRRREALGRSRARSSVARLAPLGASLWLGACADSKPSDSVKLGVLLPYTGEASALSANLEKASLLAAGAMNRVGGVGDVPVQVIFGNTFSDPERAVQEARALVERGVVAIVGPGEDEVDPGLFDVLAQAGVPLFSPLVLALVPGVGTSEAPWFRMAPTPRVLGQNLAELVGDTGTERVGAIVADDAYHSQLAEAFSERVVRYASLDLVTGVDEGNFDVQALSAQLDDRMDGGLEGVMLAMHPRPAARLATELSALRGSKPLPQWYLTPRLKTELLLQNASPGALQGALGIAPEVFADTRNEFEASFERRSGDVPFDSTFYMYDATSVMLIAMDRAVAAGNTLPDGIAPAMVNVASFGGVRIGWDGFEQARAANATGGKMQYVGLTGPVILTADGSRSLGTSSLWAVEGGTIVDIAGAR